MKAGNPPVAPLEEAEARGEREEGGENGKEKRRKQVMVGHKVVLEFLDQVESLEEDLEKNKLK